jgi:hypothetical protein
MTVLPPPPVVLSTVRLKRKEAGEEDHGFVFGEEMARD